MSRTPRRHDHLRRRKQAISNGRRGSNLPSSYPLCGRHEPIEVVTYARIREPRRERTVYLSEGVFENVRYQNSRISRIPKTYCPKALRYVSISLRCRSVRPRSDGVGSELEACIFSSCRLGHSCEYYITLRFVYMLTNAICTVARPHSKCDRRAEGHRAHHRRKYQRTFIRRNDCCGWSIGNRLQFKLHSSKREWKYDLLGDAHELS